MQPAPPCCNTNHPSHGAETVQHQQADRGQKALHLADEGSNKK